MFNIFLKKVNLGTMLTRNIFVLIIFFLLSSCTKPKLFESDLYVFPGVKTILDNGDGTFTLEWETVPTGEVSYLVFSRSENGQYNFKATPLAKLSQAQWTTPNLRFSGNTCFVVRFLKTDSQIGDDNLNEKCTAKPAYEFKGLESVSLNVSGVPILSWTAIPMEGALYQVFQSETPGVYDYTKPIKIVSGNNFVADPVPFTSKACFTVRYSIVGVIDDANKNEVCADLHVISTFAGINTASSSDTGSATVTWTKPTSGFADVAGYRVYSGTDFKTQVGSTTGGNTSVLVTNLAPDTTVTLGVRAFDKYGREDTNTRTTSVLIVNNQLPTFGGVDNLVQMSASSIKAVWVSSDIMPAQYNIYKSSGTANTTLTVDTVTPATTVSSSTYNSTLTGLGDEQSHCFTVKAVTSGGQKDTNTVVRCLTLPDNGAPVFSGVKTAVMTAGKATLTWDAAVGQTSLYRIYYQASSTLNFGTASTIDVASTLLTYEIPGLTDSTNYTFGVRAVDSHGAIDTNTASLLRNTGDTTPPVFNGITAATVLDENNISMTFNKSTETDVSYYSLKVKTGSGAYVENKRVYQNQISGGTHTVTLDNLILGTTYDILIKVYDTSANESTNSSATTRTTADLTPPTFAGIESATGVSGTPTSATISWNAASDNSGIKEYRVFYATSSMSALSFTKAGQFSGGSSATISGVTVNMSAAVTSGTSFVLSGLTANTTYYVRVHAIDNQNNENANPRQNSYSVPDTTPPTTPVAAYSPSGPTGATSARTFAVSGTATVGNEVRVYAGATVVGSATLSASTSFNITSTLPNTSGTYVITVKQINSYGLESASASLGNYVLDVSGPTITVVATPSPAKIGDATSLAPSTTFTFQASEGGTYNVKEGTTTISSGSITANTDKSVTVAANQLSTGDGNKTLNVNAVDGAGNISSQTVTIVVDTTAPSHVTDFMVVRDEQTGKYKLSWVPVGLEATDVVRIRRANASVTPPSTHSSGSSAAADIASTVFSASIDVGTETTAAFRAFTCDSVGNCSVGACASCSAAVDSTLTYVNDSDGETLKFKWTDGTTTTNVKAAYSRSINPVAGWDGDAGSVSNGAVLTEGDAYCAASNTCSVTFASDTPWQKRFWRVSSINSVSGGKGIFLGKIRHWAKVPAGMVFVAKEEWPQSEYGQIREKAFDFAIDKYEAYETTTAANAGGNAGSAAYPNTYNSVLKSAAGQTPNGTMDWYRFKQGCYNRTNEPELTNYIVGTATTFHPRRQIHLATDLEWFVGAAGTADVYGAGNCNSDNRNSNSPFNTGSSQTQNCISQFGARDMIGNIGEWTDGYYSNVTRSVVNTRVTYFGSSSSLSETTPVFPSGNYNNFVAGFDFALALPAGSAGSGSSVFTGDDFYLDTGTQAASRGGSLNSVGNTQSSGRYVVSLYSSPSVAISVIGGRCALAAPSPRINKFQNDSIGSKAQFYWNVSNVEAEGTLVVALAFGSSKEEIDNWNGESVTLTNGGIINFSTSAGAQSFSSSTFSGLTACGTYTPVATGSSGSCSLDLSAAPFSLSPWAKRFFKLLAYNTTISGGVGPSVVSSSIGVAHAPPGMVFVAKEDWPVENVGTTLGWDYKTGAAISTSYDGVTGPFDYAIDKYEASWWGGTGATAANTCNITAASAYPNTVNCVTQSAAGALPAGGNNWYVYKQVCENRTLEPSYATFVGNTTLARTATTGDPRKRVHLATNTEFFIGAFQTPDVGGASNCNIDNRGTPFSTGTSNTANCISRFGAMDLIGSLYEWTDDLWTISGTSATRVTFSGTGGYQITEPTYTFPGWNTIAGFDFGKLIISATGASSSFFSDNFYYVTGTFPGLHGGSWDPASFSGRYTQYMNIAATSVNSTFGPRCSLVP